MCPLCNWRRSMKQSNQLTQILTEAVKQRKTGRFLFLTLTVKNTTGDLLKSELRQMGRAIAKIFQYKKWLKICWVMYVQLRLPLITKKISRCITTICMFCFL
nr:protein rep [Lactiplantibacillus plantarum]